MKRISIFTLALMLTIGSIFTGCEAVKNANNTQKGVGIGAAGGAVIGGVLGNNIGKGGKGALGAVLGGVIGGTIGGVIGNKMDKQAREIDNAVPGAEVERIGDGIKLTLKENAVRFDTGKSTLTPTAKANLDKLVTVFNEYADTNIFIYGHTDSTGSDAINQPLSEQRAASVRAYLTGKGLVSSRFQTAGVGSAEPIASNDSNDGRSQNRRVEFAIVANQKMLEDAAQEAKQ